MVKKLFRKLSIIIIALSIITFGYNISGDTDLQKIVKSMGYQRITPSKSNHDSYRKYKINQDKYCNQVIRIEVFDMLPNSISYLCERRDDSGITQFGYIYDTKIDTLQIIGEDFSYPYETAADKQVYEKVYNENLKQYNDEILNELTKRKQ